MVKTEMGMKNGGGGERMCASFGFLFPKLISGPVRGDMYSRLKLEIEVK
jgi:hypothetical protein